MFRRWGVVFTILSLIVGCRSENKPVSQPESQPKNAPLSHANFSTRECDAVHACTFKNGREAGLNSILEIVGGGVGCIDYDCDGYVDLLFAGGGTINATEKRIDGVNCQLLRGGADWGFSNISVDVHLDTTRLYSHGITAADFDQDGFEDVLIYGYGGVVLLRNQGDGTFRESSIVDGLAKAGWVTAATWIDLNGDYDLDLYFGSYVDWDIDKNQVCRDRKGQPDVCSPNAFKGSRNTVFLSNGDGTFQLSADTVQTDQPSKTLGVVAAEFHRGQGVGLYVANDLIANFLFSRRGERYEEHAFASGVAVDDEGVANGSMGLALLDFNLDRQFDLFVTNFEHEKMGLYINAGVDLFHYESRKAGLNRADLKRVGFGVVAADFDGDADEDIVFTSGHVNYHPDSGDMRSLPAYLQNEAGKTFTTCAPSGSFFSDPTVGRGLATADLDNDGDLDLVGTSLFGPPSLVENMHLPGKHWLTVQLIGTIASRTPIGSTVELTVGTRVMARQLYGGGSYLSHSQSRLHFAWPVESTAGDVVLDVHWPDGSTTDSLSVKPGQNIVVIQGQITTSGNKRL